MNPTDTARLQAALVAQDCALSALFLTHPDPRALERVFLEQVDHMAAALRSTGAPKEFCTVLRRQAAGLVAQLPGEVP